MLESKNRICYFGVKVQNFQFHDLIDDRRQTYRQLSVGYWSQLCGITNNI